MWCCILCVPIRSEYIFHSVLCMHTNFIHTMGGIGRRRATESEVFSMIKFFCGRGVIWYKFFLNVNIQLIILVYCLVALFEINNLKKTHLHTTADIQMCIYHLTTNQSMEKLPFSWSLLVVKLSLIQFF